MDVVDGGSPASYNRMKTMAATAIAKLGAEDQNKTTSSLTTLKSAYDALTYDSYTTEQKRDLGVKKDGAAIAAQIDAVADKYLLLEDLLSYEIVDEKYAAGDEFLQSIKGKEAQYKASSIQAILDAMDAASADVDDTSAERLDNAYSSVKQTAIDDRGRAITTAIDNLSDAENANYIDVSAYTPALNKITHLDNDAYKENGEGSIAKAISNATTVLVTTSTKTYDGGTINVIDSSVEQENVDDATSAILAALYTCVRTYDVTATDGVEISGNSGRIEDGKASYGTKVNFDSSDANTAWYMSYDSASTSRNEQYLGYGSRVSTTVLGDMNVTAVTKSVSTPNLLTINRSYSDNSSTHGVTLKTYVGSTYTLPAAPAIAYYTFANYSYNGGTYNAGDTITVTNKNATVTANYTKAGGNAYTVKISSVSGNGDLYNQSASYNTKIEKSADGAYGWVKVDGGKETVYSVGSDLTYFVYDSIELKAVATKPTGYTGVPTVYLRESGLVKTPFTDGSGKTKLTINGNYVTDGYEIVEYGVLLGKATTGTITDDDVVVENSSNTDGFKVLRAKATKTVGANQFTIAVNLPSSFTGAFKYRGYVMYKDGTEIKTVYTDVENESI
jgi:hypothetical protein